MSLTPVQLIDFFIRDTITHVCASIYLWHTQKDIDGLWPGLIPLRQRRPDPNMKNGKVLILSP